jgi:aspartate aminotransferase-like enzyme
MQHPAGSIEAAWQRYRKARAAAERWNQEHPLAQVKIAPPPPENEATAVQVEAYAKQLESQLAKASQAIAAGGGK